MATRRQRRTVRATKENNPRCSGCGAHMKDPGTVGGRPAPGKSVEFECGSGIDSVGDIYESYACTKMQLEKSQAKVKELEELEIRRREDMEEKMFDDNGIGKCDKDIKEEEDDVLNGDWETKIDWEDEDHCEKEEKEDCCHKDRKKTSNDTEFQGESVGQELNILKLLGQLFNKYKECVSIDTVSWLIDKLEIAQNFIESLQDEIESANVAIKEHDDE